ncbi:hypothetical protein J6590_003033 [Homalodisca vitripennis]|nr:hypothetical protein J6590_003033 [Homalodisca vitripennis]
MECLHCTTSKSKVIGCGGQKVVDPAVQHLPPITGECLLPQRDNYIGISAQSPTSVTMSSAIFLSSPCSRGIRDPFGTYITAKLSSSRSPLSCKSEEDTLPPRKRRTI